MTWLKVSEAARHLGGISAKTLYAAVRRGQLKAARIGAGRNLLFCTEWLDEYAIAQAERSRPQAITVSRPSTT